MTSSQTAQNSVDHAGLSRQILDELFDIEIIHPTGSSFTCDPPVLDTDIDFVCKVPNIEEFYDYALENGWESSTELPGRRNASMRVVTSEDRGEGDDTNYSLRESYPVGSEESLRIRLNTSSGTPGELMMAPPSIVPRQERVPYAIGDFISFRRGNINLIVTQRSGFFDRYVKATMMAKRFNLKEKEHRIELFSAIVGRQMEVR